MHMYIDICIYTYEIYHWKTFQCLAWKTLERLHFKVFLSSLLYRVFFLMKVLPFFCDITVAFTAAGVMNSPTQTAGHQAQNVTRTSDCLQPERWQP